MSLDLPTLLVASVVVYSALGVAAGSLAVGMWWFLGPGRRWRTFHRIQSLLRKGQWPEAMNLVRQWQEGKVSFAWQGRLWKAEGECHRSAMAQALKDKDFEKGLGHALKAAHLLKKAELEARVEVVEAMLAEIRRLFATSGHSEPIHQLVARVLILQNPCLEAFFWQGLCHLRDGKYDQALASLHTARTGESKISLTAELVANPPPLKSGFLDPLLYIGAIHLRQGQPKEALRFLVEANRLDSTCPFVTWQLGTAMIAAGGDTQLAVRALQRTLGPRGFLQWKDLPHKAWVEGFPEQRSYVRRLAAKNPYPCPLWGSDVQQILRLGNIALGQGLYRLGNFRESAEVFAKLLQEGAPSAAVLRGLGLAQARLGQYDEAFKHLRTAHELEEPKDRLTAGYLALCGAKGKPKQEEDKPRNVLWAIRLVNQFTAPGDVEWATLVNAIYAEARGLGLAIDADDQLYLCEHLLSVSAADPVAAEAYHHLQATHPQVMHREYAWLYCRAAQQHNLSGPQALALFGVTFADSVAARDFFDKRQWNFDDVEVTFLERAATLAPGAFPAVLGSDYAPRGEKILLERSAQQEQAQQADAALASAETLLKLAPHNARAHDRLAYLYHRRGDSTQALAILEKWSAAYPREPLALVRQAILHQQRGEPAPCHESIHKAMHLAQGPKRAELAFLGARLLLQSCQVPEGRANGERAKVLANAGQLLEECLHHDPRHAEGLWLLAAIRSLLGDKAGLAKQAAAMARPEIADARFHFLAGVCQLAAGDYPAVLQACQRTRALSEKTPAATGAKTEEKKGTPLSLVLESGYLEGWAQILQGQAVEAAQALRLAASKPEGPSAGHARALLGQLAFQAGALADAIKWWQSVEPKKRSAWKISETLAGTVFLTALEALQEGKYEKAAEKLREAGKLGWRDRRLGPLLTLSLVKAGQKFLYHPVEAATT